MHARLPGRLGENLETKEVSLRHFKLFGWRICRSVWFSTCDSYHSIIFVVKQHNQIDPKIKMTCMFCLSLKRCFLWITFAGEFLALTGARLNGKELVASGLATHFVPSEVKFGLPCIGSWLHLSRNDNLSFIYLIRSDVYSNFPSINERDSRKCVLTFLNHFQLLHFVTMPFTCSLPYIKRNPKYLTVLDLQQECKIVLFE